jgi:serine/threonine protein kinase
MKLQANTLLINRYQILDSLGQGGFGFSYLALDNDLNKKFCIKELFVDGVSVRQGDSVTITENKSKKAPIGVKFS